jgi:hypothetical protein
MVKKFAAAKSCGKDAKWKSQKATFPLCLEIPNSTGFPLFAQLRLLLF